MIIAQITDLHIGFGGPNQTCENTNRLKAVIAELNSLIAQPDLVLITGDLVEGGELWAYKNLKSELEHLNAPYYLALGNHDQRAAFQATFEDIPFTDGFLQYTIENWPLRIVVLDSLHEGRHGGAFCERRAKWLKETLAQDRDRPTLIALHHPPIETGIAWMTASKEDTWAQRLEGIISEHNNIVQIISGHIHRTIFKRFAGTLVSVTQAVAPQVKLELADIDPDKPDNRVLLNDGRAAYSLHHWQDGALTTHHAAAPEGRTIVRYDEAHASVVRKTLDLS
ncbi:3',5'-cyclic adenosine monophosphate phosphodiesterase CpdA [Litorimonas cladophorae]|uniref:3',5'-cyclic adenosine monophosphate phosphodiesterase CpdA n=2 Tax=Litorimonas cladophorae TaxID=1220491 RepID=A0A918KLX6_9PROT|nr:3',5'-cyclic adenosine monophosphate phosphodiesterase CpdA [Litorimonas cladophorae]